MSGFYLSTKIQSSIIHYHSHRLSNFRHIEKESVLGRWAIPNYIVHDAQTTHWSIRKA